MNTAGGSPLPQKRTRKRILCAIKPVVALSDSTGQATIFSWPWPSPALRVEHLGADGADDHFVGVFLCQVGLVGVLSLQLLIAEAAIDGVVGRVQLPHMLRIRDVVLEGGHANLTVTEEDKKNTQCACVHHISKSEMLPKLYSRVF